MKFAQILIFSSALMSCVFASANDDLCDPQTAKNVLMKNFTAAAAIDMERTQEFKSRVQAIDGGSKTKGSANDTLVKIIMGDEKVLALQSQRAPLVISFLQGLGELSKQGYQDCAKAKILYSITHNLKNLATTQWNLIDQKFSVKYPKKTDPIDH